MLQKEWTAKIPPISPTEDEFYLIPGTLDRPPKDEYEGIWRLAIKDDPKAHLLFMRFANTGWLLLLYTIIFRFLLYFCKFWIILKQQFVYCRYI